MLCCMSFICMSMRCTLSKMKKTLEKASELAIELKNQRFDKCSRKLLHRWKLLVKGNWDTTEPFLFGLERNSFNIQLMLKKKWKMK